jgi:hypothetical protein
VESVDAVENSVGGHGRVWVGPCSELTIDKNLERMSAGEIGFSVEDGKAIMAHLQQVVVNQRCEAYVLTSRFWADGEGFHGSRIAASARSGRCSAPLLKTA